MGSNQQAESMGSLLVVANTTTWSSAKKFIQEHQAQAYLIQEHRLSLQEDIEEASSWLGARGLHALWTAAMQGKKGGAGGGTAIIADRLIGLHTPPGHAQAQDSLFTAGIATFPGIKPIMLASLYLKVGMGTATLNIQALAEIIILAEGWRLPFFAGGDFNSGPAAVIATQLPFRAGAVVSSPLQATCITRTSRSIIDFAMLSQCLSPFVDNPIVMDNTCLATHRPVAYNIRGYNTVPPQLQIRKHKKMGTFAPFGPSPCPADWTAPLAVAHQLPFIIRDNPRAGHIVEEAMRVTYKMFADTAEGEIAGKTGTDLLHPGMRGNAPRLVQRMPSWSWRSPKRPVP